MTTNLDNIRTPQERLDVIEPYACNETGLDLGDYGQVVAFVHSVCAELLAVRTELDELRASLAREVRTERLVVVHPDDGRELVYTDRLDDSITLEVAWLPESEDQHTKAAMTSVADGVHVGSASIFVGDLDGIGGILETRFESDDDGGAVSRTDLSVMRSTFDCRNARYHKKLDEQVDTYVDHHGLTVRHGLETCGHYGQ